MATSNIRKKLQSHASKGYKEISGQADDLYKIYVSARKNIEERIKEHVLTGRTSFTGTRLVKLKNEIQNICGALEKEYRKNHKRINHYLIESFYQNALHDIFRNNPLNKVMLKVDQDLINTMLNDDFAHIAGATKKMSDQTCSALRRISSQVLNKATLTGETTNAIAQELFFRNGGNSFQFIAANGARWNSDAYFKMLARTTLFNNSRDSYIKGCANGGQDIVTISVSANPCDKCIKYEDRLLSISGSHSKYMSLDSAISDGLFHPNCTHRVIAVDEVDQEMDYDEKGNPSNSFVKDVKVPGNKKAQIATTHKDIKLTKKLTDREIKHLRSYTNDSHSINDYLRDKSTGNINIDRQINAMNSAVHKAVIKKEITLYRGFECAETKMMMINGIDNKIPVNRFQSTSTMFSQAKEFAGVENDGAIILKIKCSANQHALPIDKISHYEHESEILLKKGGYFKVNSVNLEKIDDTEYAIMEVDYEPSNN